MTAPSHVFNRVEAMFGEPNLVANAGRIVPVTGTARLDLEQALNDTVCLEGRVAERLRVEDRHVGRGNLGRSNSYRS